MDLISSEPLDALVQYLVSAGLCELGTYQTDDGQWHCSFEIVGEVEDGLHANADATIAAMLEILEALPKRQSDALNACVLREFNVAYDVAEKPRDFSDPLSSVTVARMAALSTTLRTTLYPADD